MLHGRAPSFHVSVIDARRYGVVIYAIFVFPKVRWIIYQKKMLRGMPLSIFQRFSRTVSPAAAFFQEE